MGPAPLAQSSWGQWRLLYKPNERAGSFVLFEEEGEGLQLGEGPAEGGEQRAAPGFLSVK